MKTLILTFAFSSLLLFYSCTSQKEEIYTVRSYDNTITVINQSMYFDVLQTDMYYITNASMILRNLTLFSETIAQEQSDFRQNKVKQIQITLDYGKDSTKKDYALLKINRSGQIEEYTPQYLSAFKAGLKYSYDYAGRLSEILGVSKSDKKIFSFYKFLYSDNQLSEFIKWQGSVVPEYYKLSYTDNDNNSHRLLQIAGAKKFLPEENYYVNYTAEFNSKNKISDFTGKFLSAPYKILYSEENSEKLTEDTIKCFNIYKTEIYILNNNRITSKIFIREAGGEKSYYPAEGYETINYTYGENNLLSNIESSVRDFPTFNLSFIYSYYED